MDKCVTSNILGTFVFDENFKVVEHIDKPVLDGEWTSEEQTIIDKYDQDKLFYVGFKARKIPGIKISKDPKKQKEVSSYLKTQFKQFYEANLKRTKQVIKDSVQNDLLTVQTIKNIDEINKVANMLSKRLREWYELYNPEFSNSIDDHETFINLILENDKKDLLEELKIEQTMGADLKEEDVEPILNLARKIKTLYELRDEQETYLESKMKLFCPNLLALAGTIIGAKLLAQAGDMRRLMLMPASTIQVLGAEKALFRHIKTGARPPKYGVLINHPIVVKADNKGKAARKLADKICIGIKVDYFKGEFIGDKLRKQLESQSI